MERLDSEPTHKPEQGNLSSNQFTMDKKPHQTASKSNQLDSQGLVSTKVLPALDLTRDPQQEWTVVVLLGSTLPGSSISPLGAGAESKLESMKTLAADTKGKPVNFIVYAERTTDAKGHVCHANTGSNGANIVDCDYAAIEKNRTITERYFIHDGKIDKLPDLKDKSSGNAITSLLQDAQSLAPSALLGLMIQAHGNGADGIKTNLGKVSLKQTTNSIKAGLAGGKHSKLDLLDFDACNMADPKVLETTSSVTNNLLASSSVEYVGKNNDGQNLKADFEALLANPALSGKELGSEIVEQSKNKEHSKDKNDGVLTLANFDMSRYLQFKQSLDKFGAELNEAMGDQNMARTVRAAVDGSSVADAGGQSEYTNHYKDLKSFAKNILKAAEAGKLNVPELTQSARDLLEKFEAMAIAQKYSDRFNGQSKGGGLAIFLPGKEILDRTAVGKLHSPLHELAQKMGILSQTNSSLSDRQTLADGVDQLIMLMDLESGRSTKESKSLKQIQQRMAGSKTLSDLSSAVTQLHEAAAQLENSSFGKTLANNQDAYLQEMWTDYQQKTKPSTSPNWDSFVSKLDSTQNLVTNHNRTHKLFRPRE